MDYKLALSLRDAGFPFTRKLCAHPCEGTCFPTLSELIEACPKWHEIKGSPRITYAFTLQGESPEWIAGYCYLSEKHFQISEKGSTPEEAVALLWIALNSKKV